MANAKHTVAHILIAEDDPFLQKLLAMHLRREGFDVALARDGREALTAIEKQIPSLLLLDLLMPGTDGFEVLQELKEKGTTFPILILSNLGQDIDRQKCTELGATDYLIKSNIDPPTIVAKVREILTKETTS